MREVRSKVKISDTQTRHLVRVYSDACDAGTNRAYQVQYQILADLAYHRQISVCGDGPFDTMRMRHDGTCWVVEFEALRTEATK